MAQTAPRAKLTGKVSRVQGRWWRWDTNPFSRSAGREPATWEIEPQRAVESLFSGMQTGGREVVGRQEEMHFNILGLI